jgi:hypothetical protein
MLEKDTEENVWNKEDYEKGRTCSTFGREAEYM